MQLNAYTMYTEVRDLINEPHASLAHWAEASILRKMQIVEQMLFNKMSLTCGDWFVTSAAVTATSGVITLPTDCAKPVLLRDATNDYSIPFVSTVREKDLYSDSTVGYFLQDSIVVESDSFSGSGTLYYQKRLPYLIFGQAGTGSAASALVLPVASNPSAIDDYYNGAIVEIFQDASFIARTTITDYVASTRVATVTGTVTAADHFGTISVLPQEVSYVIPISTAVLALAKPSAAIDPKYFSYLKEREATMLEEAIDWMDTRASASRHIRIVEED